MSKLDDKLIKITLYHANSINDPDKFIAEIKQAFTEDAAMQIAIPGFMTGQEFYNRFLKEYMALSPRGFANGEKAKMAAKKAAGLK